jgi:PAS domain S-box-containing protein
MSRRDTRRGWADLSLRSKGILVVGIPMIGLLAAAMAAIGLGARQLTAERRVEQSLRIRTDLQNVLIFLLNAETGVRGYVLTGSHDFLEPFRKSRQTLSFDLTELRALVAEDPPLRDLAERVVDRAGRQFLTLNELRTLAHQPGKAAAARRDSLLRQGQLQMDALRALLDRMRMTENRLFLAAESGQERAKALTYLAVVASLAFGVAGGVAATMVFTRGVVARIRRLQENAVRLANGEPLDPLRSGDDEIGRLGVALQEADDLLKSRDLEIRQSEEKFRLIAENADDIIYRYRLFPTPQMEYISPSVTRVLGYTPDDFYTNHTLMQEVIHPDDRRASEADRSDPDQASGTLALRVVRKDGAVIWIERRMGTVRDEEGNPTAVQGIARDVTERKRAEEEESRLRAFLDSVIENIPHMVFVKDAKELRFIRFNRAGEELTGHSREEWLGKNDYDMFPVDEADFFTAKDREVLDRRQLVEIPEEPIQTREGELRVLHTKKIPILDRAGTPQYLLGISEDITERKRSEEALRESEAQKTSILASMAEGTVVTELDGTIVSVNTAMERMAGWTESEIRGSPFTDVYGLREGERESHDWEETLLCKAIRTGEILASRGFGKTLLTRDGRHLPVAVTASPLLDEQGNVLGGIEVIRDVSYEREMDQLKSSLVSTVSHELRTPLTMIQGFSELLLDRDLSDQRSKEALHQIRNAAERLSRLIEDLLSVSRIESGRLVAHVAPVELEPVLAEVIAPFLAGRTIEVGLDGVSTVMADRDKLVQILTNLVSNAVKYSPPGTDIAIGGRADGRTVLIEVRDHGIGMTEEERSRLFEKFFRADRSEVKEAGGTGLGLYITRSLLEMQGGRIWVESEPGQGSTFVFSLPAASMTDEAAS